MLDQRLKDLTHMGLRLNRLPMFLDINALRLLSGLLFGHAGVVSNWGAVLVEKA